MSLSGEFRVMLAAGENISGLFKTLSLPANEDESERLIERLIHGEGTRVLSFLNAHAVNLAVRDQQFYASLTESDVLLRDGVGVKIGCELLGRCPGPNLNGTDLIPRLI